MATIKQLEKQIATAVKRIEEYDRKKKMYRERTLKACERCSINIGDIIPITRNSWSSDYKLPDDVEKRISWDEKHRITNNYAYMVENRKNADNERKHLQALNDEYNVLLKQEREEKARFNTALADAFNDALKDFKVLWFDKMRTWHKNHHAYINAHKSEAKERYNRADRCKWYFAYRRQHYRIQEKLKVMVRRLSSIINDRAGRMSFEDYMQEVEKDLIRTWSMNIVILTKKCEKMNVDCANIATSDVSVTDKGFSVYITDGKPRRIYARMIWAAENSILVEPHTRYIVTEKRI